MTSVILPFLKSLHLQLNEFLTSCNLNSTYLNFTMKFSYATIFAVAASLTSAYTTSDIPGCAVRASTELLNYAAAH